MSPKKANHFLDLSDMTTPVPQAVQDELERIIQETNLAAHEIKLLGLSLKRRADRSLKVVLLIQNGTDQSIAINRLPLKIFDKDQKLLAAGTFDFKDLMVAAHSSKPMTITFPATSVRSGSFDSSEWTIQPVND